MSKEIATELPGNEAADPFAQALRPRNGFTEYINVELPMAVARRFRDGPLPSILELSRSCHLVIYENQRKDATRGRWVDAELLETDVPISLAFKDRKLSKRFFSALRGNEAPVVMTVLPAVLSPNTES